MSSMHKTCMPGVNKIDEVTRWRGLGNWQMSARMKEKQNALECKVGV